MNIKTFARVALSTSMLVALGAGVSSASAMTAAECHAAYQHGRSKLSFAEYRAAHCVGVRARTTKADVSKAAHKKLESKETSARSKTRHVREKAEDAKSGVEKKAESKRSGFFHKRKAAEDRANEEVSSTRDSVEKTAKKGKKKSFFSRAAATAGVGGVVFPNKVSPKFASLPEGLAREKTCAAQYEANKENGGNGDLVWTQQGGGYWSECNAHLKGE